MRTLITGAGGSIGSSLVKKILADDPSADLALIDLSEYALYTVAQLGAKRATYVLADIRDPGKMTGVFCRYTPDLVLHCAALKHVPMMENPQNAIEGIKTNILGTQNVLDAAHASGVQRVVIVSTDKAVKPISMMGATKTFVERYASEDATTRANGMHTIVVRFGNVQGSSGSVIPLWEKQIAGGGPVTVTDARMMRYFMSIEEAVSLVMKVAAQDATTTFNLCMLAMGKLQSVQERAELMIGDRPIDIVHTGIRPGEKLVEELYDPAHEVPMEYSEGIISLATMRRTQPNEYLIAAAALRTLAAKGDFSTCVQILQDITGYRGSISSAGL